MIKVGSIVIDCKNFGKMSAFWGEALHYELSRPPDLDDLEPSSILKDISGNGGPNVTIDQMQPLRGKIHLDLYSDEPTKRLNGCSG